jgi:hypothetical protein
MQAFIVLDKAEERHEKNSTGLDMTEKAMKKIN